VGQRISIEPSGQAAYIAIPQSGSGPGILVLHAWWGLTADIEGFCDLLAEHGFVALAPSLYPGDRTADSIAGAEELIEEHDSDPSVAAQIVLAALSRLKSLPEVSSDQLGVIGFSMGAYWTLWLAEERPNDIAAAVAVYGSSDSDFQRANADFLLHFAENDDYEPAHAQQALEQTLHDAGKEVTAHVYPGTGHWFVEPSRTDVYDREAAELMWERTIDFFTTRLS